MLCSRWRNGSGCERCGAFPRRKSRPGENPVDFGRNFAAASVGLLTPGRWEGRWGGLILGITLGLVTWLPGFYREGWDVATVVFLAMAGIVLVLNLIGGGLPFLLSWLRLDPAIASGPLITSVADVAGLLIYFSIATYFLRSTI